jgi:hypothetical protein
MSDKFYNRLGDNYRMLFAIADLAAGEWPEQARGAAERLSGAIDMDLAQRPPLGGDQGRIRRSQD